MSDRTTVTIMLCMLVGITAANVKAAERASLANHTVRFAVLGDRTGGHVENVYEQIIPEVERLKPEFVITVGDMIEGYTEDSAAIETEWMEYLTLVEPLTMPIYYTPGNHDITTDYMERFYRRHIGDPHCSFSHRGIHFIVLDNSRWDSSAALPHEQLEWLVSDLSEHRDAAWTFVFCHKPFWYNTTAMGRADTLHRIFTSYGVDAVVTGHFHRYFSGVYDGIRYVSIGSSGGDMGPEIAGLGFHFGWVTVDDNEIAVAPIKINAVLAQDHITADELHLTESIELQAVAFPNPVPVNQDRTVSRSEVSVELFNPSTDFPVEDTLEWKIPAGWQVQPAEHPVAISPGQRTSISFQVEGSGDLYPVPTLAVSFPFGKERMYPVTEDLRIARQVVCTRATSPPTIDGRVTEAVWQTRESYLFAPDGSSATVDSVWFSFAHDQMNLYLAAYCFESQMDSLRASVAERDGAVYGEDCVGFFFQPDPEVDTVYQIYFNPLGAVFDQKISFRANGYYDGDREWNGEYEVKTHHGNTFWEFEARIPLTQLGATADSGQEWGINFRRKQKRLDSSCDWQVPIDYNPKTFGTLVMK